MKKKKLSLQDIYLSKIGEAVTRLDSVTEFMHMFESHAKLPYLEAAILQLRKAMESIAIAAIAPDKNKYQELRNSYTNTKDTDFSKDYHAAKIFEALSKINPDFYPLPLTPASQKEDGVWHYGKRESDVLSKKQFVRAYDRLGKYLHSTNPWGEDKNIQNLVADIPAIVRNARGLINLHARFIRAKDFHGVWMVEADSPFPRIVMASADSPFVVLTK